MDGGNTAVAGFEDALKAVETVVATFNTATGDERKSQEAKNAALYAALNRAFQFHRSWKDSEAYAGLLAQRKIIVSTNRKDASEYLPTIKVFFEPDLDTIKPTDAKGTADKLRRQKSISTYSKVLEYAASDADGSKDVAAFIAAKGGIEAARVEWRGIVNGSDDAKAEAQKAEETKAERYAAGLEVLKGKMAAAIPKSDTIKAAPVLAALYFDEAGVPHFLGFPPADDSSKVLLEKFVLSHGPKPTKTAKAKAAPSKRTPPTNLDKLLRLVAIAKVAHSSDANIKIVNGPERCELWASHGSTKTCMAHAVLTHQDYLPEGEYWFDAKGVKAMQQLAKLGQHGAQFAIDGPLVMNGRTATVNVTVTGHEEAIKAFNAKAGMVSWNWLDAIPQGDASCRTRNDDDTTTIAYKAVTDKLARAKPILEWEAEITIEGDFAAWLDKTLGVDRKDANARLVSAVHGDKSSKLTVFHIDVMEWVLKDRNGDVERFSFNAPIGKADFSTELTIGVGEMLAAMGAVKALAGDGTVTVSLVDKFMRVRCEVDGNAAEVFIPSYVGEGRYSEMTGF